METFNIWARFIDNGGKADPIYFGSAEGKDFKDACIKLAEINDAFYEYFNEETMTWWGCSLYDNKVDASRSFG